MTRCPLMAALAAVAVLLTVVAPASAQQPSGKVTFKKTVLDTTFRSEGVAVGDFNHDGKRDIAAGTVWYAAPDWKMQLTGEKAPEHNPLAYSRSFQTFAEDLSGDGWDDIIVVEFPGEKTTWLENPKKPETAWPRHTLAEVTNNESPQLVDVDGDGKRDLLAAFSPDPKNVDGPERKMGFFTRQSDATKPWTIHAVSAAGAPSTNRFSHGVGLGDVNGDRRGDIVVPQGWWEASENGATGEWKFHAAPLGENCAQMYVYDFDGDGDGDVLSSAAHAVGMWWHEQLPEGKWKTHEIDKSFTQTHALCLADINGDGLADFVTGKRWWAHGPKGDIDPDKPAVMYWFELQREGGKPRWIPHQFDHDSGVGTQFEVADVNGDGLLDVVTANKKGAYYFQQARE
ncbi:MAG: VCBS repeat-containing protein [Planctomycetaceae bacterium]|nr:VCBS repeat-containing protein [Planctomycetaceae bacterium]